MASDDLSQQASQLPSTERRCERCNIPSPSHSDASDNGGVSLNKAGVCRVCRDYKDEYGYYPDTRQTALTDS